MAAAAVLALAGVPAFGVVYTDATGENFDGNAHMDISSVEVTDDGTNITFKINVSAASITSPADWGKYLVGIDTSDATGDTGSPVGNPWGRNIRMTDGMDAFIGSWVDSGGGFQPWTFSGSWTQNGTGAVTLAGSSTTITTSLASLGLSQGQTIEFDVYTSGGGGGDSANDAAANPLQSTTGWGGPYTTASNSGLTYTLVPEPGTIGLMGMGGLLLLRRRQRA
jgi:hypothetical protein